MGLATSKDYNHRMKERFSEVSQWKLDVSACHVLLHIPSLRSRRLEVVGTRKNGRAPVLSLARYFQAPATQASIFLLRLFEVYKYMLRP